MNILIVGAGYVGLPLAVAFSKTLKVVCYDIDKDRIYQLKDNSGYKSNQNIQRDNNIALVNILYVLFHKINISTNEVF